VTTSHSSPALISTGSDSEKSSLLIGLSNDRLKAPQAIFLKGPALTQKRPPVGPAVLGSRSSDRMLTSQRVPQPNWADLAPITEQVWQVYLNMRFNCVENLAHGA
jgi:hypothetical protein